MENWHKTTVGFKAKANIWFVLRKNHEDIKSLSSFYNTFLRLYAIILPCIVA